MNRGVLCLASRTQTGASACCPGVLAARRTPAARSFRKTPSAVRILPGHVHFPSPRHRLAPRTRAAAGSPERPPARARGAAARLRAHDRRDRRPAAPARRLRTRRHRPRGPARLLRAIRAWQPERGPFPAFAAICARNQALSALDAAGARKHQLLSRARSLEDHQPRAKAPLKLLETPAPASDAHHPGESEFCAPLGEQLPAVSTDTDPLRVVIAREQLDAMLGALPTLTPCERLVIAGTVNDKSQRQLAAEHGLSRKAVMVAQRTAREKLAAQQTLAA